MFRNRCRFLWLNDYVLDSTDESTEWMKRNAKKTTRTTYSTFSNCTETGMRESQLETVANLIIMQIIRPQLTHVMNSSVCKFNLSYLRVSLSHPVALGRRSTYIFSPMYKNVRPEDSPVESSGKVWRESRATIILRMQATTLTDSRVPWVDDSALLEDAVWVGWIMSYTVSLLLDRRHGTNTVQSASCRWEEISAELVTVSSKISKTVANASK